VFASWSGGAHGDAFCTTDADGKCEVSKSTKKDTITLTVNSITGDGISYSGPDSVTLDQNGPISGDPVANAGSDQTVVDSDENGTESVTLDGTGSSDDTGIVSYDWKEGGATIATGVLPSVDLTVGPHTITLTVTDDDGATDEDTVEITVSANTSDIDAHISSIVPTNQDQGGPWWRANIEVTVHDFYHLMPSGVVVSGVWSGSITGPDSCTTVNGICTISEKTKSNDPATFVFDTPPLAGNGVVYDPDNNEAVISLIEILSPQI